MEIAKTISGAELTIAIDGHLTAATTPQLDQEVRNSLEGITRLVFDFSNVEYMSSAGLRFLFIMQSIMDEQGEMIIRNPNEDVMNVFNITESQDILTIE